MAARVLRIMHVVHTTGHGGLERQVLDLASGQRARGHAVTLALHPRGWLAAQASAAALPWRPVRFRGIADAVSHAQLAWHVWRDGVDVVHGHSRRSACYSANAARMTGRCSVASVHSLHSWKGFSRNHRVIAVSDAVRNGLLGHDLPAARIARVYNGVVRQYQTQQHQRAAARAALGLPAKVLLVGMLGRMVPHKGHDVLLRALTMLPPHVHVCLLGDAVGPWPDQLRAMAGALGIAARVHLSGFQTDPARALRALDVLVQPSRSEALSLSLLEAMALGLPVVAARTGGMPEVVTDGHDGLLFEPGDASALARAIMPLQDETLRSRLGAQGWQTQRARFCRDAMVAATDAVYLEALNAQEACA